MSDLESNRIVRTFADLRAGGRKALLPFLTAGFPDLATTEALLGDLASRGVRVCELGVPFSDPIADGPVIQASYTEALAKGVTSDAIFDMVRRFRAKSRRTAGSPKSGRGSSKSEIRPTSPAATPWQGNPKSEMSLLAMVSYSIVFRHGVVAYLDAAAKAGFDGLIVPDLPLEEAGAMEKLATSRGLCNVLLVAPTTPAERRLEIARHSRGFVYYVSVAGITGERDRLPRGTIDGVAELRRHTDTPICVGFGVSNAATVAEVCRTADGAIVGSAIVHRIRDAAAKGLTRAKLVRRVGDFVGELLQPLA